MTKISHEDDSYNTFQELLTGYRLSNALQTAFEAGVFDIIGNGVLSSDEICKRTGWDPASGKRFLLALCGLGLLHRDNGCFSLSKLSDKFLLTSSENFQGRAIEFENRLVASWQALNSTLLAGERQFGSEEKSEADYRKALELYLDAMHDAAKVRAVEVWDKITPENEGRIIDAGAGSGAFLSEFLNRHKGWSGVFCDLKDVIDIAKEKSRMESLSERMRWVETNLLESGPSDDIGPCDILLMSNLVHCQGKKETVSILSNLTDLVSEAGVIIIHDFFSDCGWRGALYDIHMMLNTYNGRTYSLAEMADMLSEFSFVYTKHLELKSGSAVLVASGKKISPEFIL